MERVSFDEVWEDLKNEDEESKRFFQTAEDISKLINRLSEERIRQGLTQTQLAAKAGLKQSAIARLERAASIPRLDTVAKIADALGLEINLEEKTRIESVSIIMPKAGGFSWRNTGANAGHYQYNRFSGCQAQGIA